MSKRKSYVTTKQGDTGTTRTLGGEKLSKGHPILECSGHLDTLRAHTALLRIRLIEAGPPGVDAHADFLWWLLHVYFVMGTEISDPKNAHPEYRQGTVDAACLARLEAEQARLEAALELPKAFIVSASTSLSAEIDLNVTIVRDLERELARLRDAVPEFNAGALLAFTNRLSDYLFVLARTVEAGNHLNVDYGVLGG